MISLGHRAGVTETGCTIDATEGTGLWIENARASAGPVIIRYAIPAQASIVLALYDAGGHQVRTLVSAPRARGRHDVTWDCRDDRGHLVAPGVYYCRLAAGDETQSTPVVLVR
jgi:flagellar hook assembly protein FlgD